MNPFLCNFLCTYALIKHLFGCTAEFRQSDDLKRISLRILVITVTLLVYILIGCLLLVLFILHHSVDAYLRIKLGPAYGGMLTRQDSALAALKDKVPMRAVVILNQDKDQSDVWASCLAKAKKFHSSSYKLSSHVKSCLGYSYFVKDQTKFEDVAEEVYIENGDHITKEEFLDYLDNVLPAKDKEKKRLWSMQYFPQPIHWNHKSKTTKQYVGIYSFEHCLSDGPNLMKYVMEHLMDKGPYRPPQSNVLLNNLKHTSKLSLDDAYINNNPYMSTDDFPKLYKNPSDAEYTAIYSEDTEKYLNLIKQVKTKIGVGFNSVLMGALSSSLTDYLKKKNKPPMDLGLINVVRPEEINLVFKSNDVDPLINDVGHQTIMVPAEKATLDTSKRLQAINESLNQVRRSLDSTTIYMMSKFIHIIPSTIQRMGLRSFWRGLNSMFSNISSLKDLTYGGHVLEALFFFVSNLPPAFLFGITSLNGRLQLTLHASGSYVSNRKELEDILHGALEYIDKFSEELQIA